ncbi:MAG: hypothetical protein QXS19_09905, partial [Candidatus Methanomethylicia archaeon]
MRYFMIYLISTVLTIMMTDPHDVQVFSSRFHTLSSYQYKSGYLYVSKLCSPEHIKKHFIDGYKNYRIRLYRLANLVQVNYRIFPTSMNTYEKITVGSTVTFNFIT